MGLPSFSPFLLIPLLLTFTAAASGHRFLVGGDTLYFNYGDDSVVEVSREGYNRCDALNPISSFGGGGAEVKLDRHGFFFFISGNQTNCEAGQRLIIRVMVQDTYRPISRAPAGGWEGAGLDSSSAGVVAVGWGVVVAMAAVSSFVQ